LGLVTANGGYLTKHAFGVYSTEPPPQPFQHANLQDEVDRTPRRELASEVDSPVTVETSTVTHDREGNPERAILSTLLPDGRRAWAITSDPVAMKEIETAETGGRPGHVSPDASFEFEA
jgi:acetyl-CoA C-acetyltransferase